MPFTEHRRASRPFGRKAKTRVAPDATPSDAEPQISFRVYASLGLLLYIAALIVAGMFGVKQQSD